MHTYRKRERTSRAVSTEMMRSRLSLRKLHHKSRSIRNIVRQSVSLCIRDTVPRSNVYKAVRTPYWAQENRVSATEGKCECHCVHGSR
jgi:hypothetical protein